MNFGVWCCLLVTARACTAEKWQWPEEAASVRIDTKVRFIEGQDKEKLQTDRQADEVPFHEPSDTEGFYNRAGRAGRYPVRVETPRAPYRVDGQHIYSLHDPGRNQDSDGTLDSLQYCKCVSTPDCNPRPETNQVCGTGKFLCCYRGHNKVNPQNTEYFNEIDDERPSLLPGRENFARFPPPAGELHGVFTANQDSELLDTAGERGVLTGPQGPAGRPNVLVGPGGPTGVIGPAGPTGPANRNPDVLVGPGGPTGVIGPGLANYDKGILVGPDGSRDIGPSESAQRGVLVGPGGPTGIIGPRGYGGGRPVLVGPGGPTGFIGPRRNFGQFMGRQSGPGILVGPGGPTGMIGPGRALLVGPGGPTGIIGPRGYFGY